MATTVNASFQTMLNEYLPNDLFKDDLIQRDWYLNSIQKDNNWKGGDIIVPFQGAAASSIKFGGLTSDADISEYEFVRGKISGYKEVWGSLVFNETDIMQHDGRVNEQSFLRILPDQIEDFMNNFKMAVSINLLAGPHFATVKSIAGAATGVLEVDKIDRFEIGQKVDLAPANLATKTTHYVISIDVNAATITLAPARGAAAVDISAVAGLAIGNKMYHDGVLVGAGPYTTSNAFHTVRQALLPAALGGSDTLHGETKSQYPALQAIRKDGSGVSTGAELMKALFDTWNDIKAKAKKANPDTAVMSYKNMGFVMAAIEDGIVSGTGQSIHRVTATNPKINKYGWTEITITGVKGSFKLVAVQEMDDDVVYFLDMSAMTFRTNGYIMKKKSPEGLEYYRTRSASGYKLVCDLCLFGEHEFRKPASCGVLYGLSL